MDGIYFNSFSSNIFFNEKVGGIMKNKKAELTTKQIVILIVLIISFAIIIFFLFRLNLGSESDKQLCYNSVMNRANKLIPTDAVPLNCQRSYVCITKGNGDCGMIDPIKKKVKTKEEVYLALGDELADCWWMFGEGKVDYLGGESFSKLYCSICSQIKFDESLKDIFGVNEFNKKDVFDYFSKTKLNGQGGPTYLEYLYGSNDLVDPSQKINFGIINLDKQYYSLMGMSSDVGALDWVTNVAIAGAIVGGLIIAPLTGGTSAVLSISLLTYVAGGAVVGGVAGGVLVAPVIKVFSDKDAIPPYLVEVGSEEFVALNCKDITTRS